MVSTQPPIQWVPGQNGQGVGLPSHFCLLPRWRMRGDVLWFPPMNCHGGVLAFIYIHNKNCGVTRLATSEIRRCGYLVCAPCFHTSACRMCPWQIEQLVQIRKPWKHVVVWMWGFLRKYHASVSLDSELSLLFLSTGLYISPSGIPELYCATTKSDTAERNISIGRESLQVFLY